MSGRTRAVSDVDIASLTALVHGWRKSNFYGSSMAHVRRTEMWENWLVALDIDSWRRFEKDYDTKTKNPILVSSCESGTAMTHSEGHPYLTSFIGDPPRRIRFLLSEAMSYHDTICWNQGIEIGANCNNKWI